MKSAIATLALLAGALALPGRAEAYPQFQLSRDQTCTSCHLLPAGGGLLGENGLATAEAMSQLGTNPSFLNEAVTPPSWLVLGGDLRAMAGYLQAPQRYLLGFPMQADVSAAAYTDAISLHATVGYRPPRDDSPGTAMWPREHFLMWQSERGASEGLWIRAGQFMPVFGLRLVEHTAYTRRHGGVPLYAETYGVSVSRVTARYEAHLTGFVRNSLWNGVQQGDGGAAYGEYRLSERSQLGAGGMVAVSDWQQTYRANVTAKHFVPGADLLLQGEVQAVVPRVGDYYYTQLVGYLMGSYFATDAVMIDVGLGHYDANLAVHALDRNALDVNVHWFLTSHLEAMLVNRVEVIGKGDGGASSGFSFVQLHYRL